MSEKQIPPTRAQRPKFDTNVSVGKAGTNSNVAGRDVVVINQNWSNTSTEEQTSAENKIRERGVKLRKKLKKAVCSESFNEHDLVPLQIVKYKREEGGKFKSGSDGRRQWKQTMINKSSKFYKAKKLFDEAQKLDQTFVGVVGEPGVGKTSLAKDLLKSCANSTASSGDDEPYFFYVSFRGMDFTKETSVFELLIKTLLPDWKCNREEDDAVLQRINKSRDIYVFTDALDEAKSELLFTSLAPIGLYDRATPDVIIKSIFSGRLLPNAKKLVTSRPDAFLDLQPECKPKFSVRILGLSEASQKSLSMQICDHRDQEYSKIQETLDAIPDISALCCVPLYYKVIVKHLRSSFQTNPHYRVTSTSLLTEVFDLYVRSEYHRGKPVSLKALTQLALNGMKDDKFVFDINDLRNIDKESLKNFLHSETCRDIEQQVLESDKRFFFFHPLWQEYFAALHLMYVSQAQELLDFYLFYYLFGTYRLKNVMKFLFGCQNTEARVKLTDIFLLLSKRDLFLKKRDHLKYFIKQSYFSFEPDMFFEWEQCIWVFEANDDELTQYAADHLPKRLNILGTIIPRNLIATFSVLLCKTSDPRQIFIDMAGDLPQSTTFLESSLRLLLDGINKGGHQVKQVSLLNAILGKAETEALLLQTDNIDHIKLQKCTFPEDFLERISDQFKKKNVCQTFIICLVVSRFRTCANSTAFKWILCWYILEERFSPLAKDDFLPQVGQLFFIYSILNLFARVTLARYLSMCAIKHTWRHL